MAASELFENTSSVVHVPLKKSGKWEDQQYVAFRISELPSLHDAVWILREEQAEVDLWHRVAHLYYKTGDVTSFLKIAEEGYREEASGCRTQGAINTRALLALLLSIGDAYARMISSPEVDRTEQEIAIQRAHTIYNLMRDLLTSSDNFYEAEYCTSQAYLFLRQGNTSQADHLFSVILSETGLNQKDFIPAILGKAIIAFSNRSYALALQHFRQVLTLDPYCPANFRVGMGHCFWKLNFKEKAKLAFERAVELFPNDPNALSALATCHLSLVTLESTITAVKLLATSFSVSKSHPVTLTLLADHFYYAKDYDRALKFADKVFQSSSNNLEVFKRSAFVMARCYQARSDLKLALHYYYLALKEPQSGFHLPYFGVSYCYLCFDDIQRSSEALRKLLEIYPKNFSARRMLGCLLCKSEDPSKRAEAQKYLKPVLNQDSVDIVARIALASSEEDVDDLQAAENYTRALKEAEKQDEIVLPEIYNNFGCTLFRLNRYEEAMKNFKSAFEVTNEIHQVLGAETDVRPYKIIINFNLARTLEASFEYGDAEKIYKSVVNDLPAYYYGFIRLGIMAREKGNLYEADAYFKYALQYSQLHPDVWSLIGNLHLIRNELDPAYKKFWKIHNMNDEMKKDSYNLISLGNLELTRLQQSIFGEAVGATNSKRPGNNYSGHMRKALGWYQQVLHREPRNMWAANGVGCILACKGLLTEARGIFHQVLETRQKDVKDVLMNIAHTYMEQKMYHNAIQIYERCNKLSPNTDAVVLQYIAKAHFLNNSYDLAKNAIIKVRRIAPHDCQTLFQLGKILRKAGWQKYQIKSETEANSEAFDSVDGLNQMRLAQKIFLSIQESTESSKELKYAAKIEYGHCEVLISKTPHMVERMMDTIGEKQLLKSKVSLEVKTLKVNQLKEKMIQDEVRRMDEEHRKRKRDEIKIKVEKVKLCLKLEHEHDQDKKKKVKKQKKDVEESSK